MCAAAERRLGSAWDPSVLFTPAGMNQFKDHFLGRCKLEFTRATTCQKCLRTGDIDNVGRTAYHHTFFEMLGNFSFGDYFKREAITWAWEFLTSKKWLGLAPERLSATVYLDDDEAAGIWTGEIGLPPEKVQRLGEDENFWPANAVSQGPDGIAGRAARSTTRRSGVPSRFGTSSLPSSTGWAPPPNNLRPLPSKNIDTGMGFERTASVLQGVESNFHIDIILPIVRAAAEACGERYDPQSEHGRRLRRIADHVRACTFAMHETSIRGPTRALCHQATLRPGGAGWPSDRQPRAPFTRARPRCRRHDEELLSGIGGNGPAGFPRDQSRGGEFRRRSMAGSIALNGCLNNMRKDGRGVVAGEDAFEMYQTHGFPPELFENMAAERNLLFDWEGYRRAMGEHQEESGPKDKGEVFRTGPVQTLVKVVGATRFVGYETTEAADAKVVGIIAANDLVDKVQEVITSRLPSSSIRPRFTARWGGRLEIRARLWAPAFVLK